MSRQSKQNNQATPSQPQLNIKDLDSAMDSFRSELEHLSKRIDILPRVEKDGSSECHFAEDLYADKEEAAEKVAQRLRDIKGYMPLAEREIARCSHNLSTISSDKGRLRDDEAITQYQDALHAQQYHYQKAVERRKALQELIQQAEQLLSKANTKKYPGKKPEKRFRPPVGLLGGLPSPGASMAAPISISPAFDRPSLPRSELGDLLSLGPLPAPLAGKIVP